MAEFFLELFSEEIPARMQRGAAADLERAIATALAAIAPNLIETYHGPRRIALHAEVASEVASASATERGPRATALEQALSGFLRKHGANREQLRQEGDFWVLDKQSAAVSAASLIASAMPGLLRRFPWPKSMRWGSSAFTWVRPLRRIVCLLDGAVVPFDLREGTDDGHGLVSGNLTEGHRFHAPATFAVSSAANWQAALANRHVLVGGADRKRIIADRIAGLAAEKHLTVADDPGLLEEVAGLVEWPVPHLGRIADEHMDLPPEVMQVSMRVNQRYFALRTSDGAAAPWFAFVANIEADDHGAAIIAGNERVLRARFSDARHFWDLDRKVRLETRVAALDKVTFQAKLGSQGDRVRRLKALALVIAPLVRAIPAQAYRAAELAKADLVTGMVGEFPELQGVMGSYYARHDFEELAVANAIRDHYAPRGPAEAAPSAPVSITVALADKLDQIAGFFAIDARPSGSGDPYALRRAALGIIRIIRENGLRVRLRPWLEAALNGHASLAAALKADESGGAYSSKILELLTFITERLLVQMRAEGSRHDTLMAVVGSKSINSRSDDDLVELLLRASAVGNFLTTPIGSDLLTAYRRAANILRIEDRKDGPHDGEVDTLRLESDEEKELFHVAVTVARAVVEALAVDSFPDAMTTMATLRAPLDAFFEKVTVNDPDPDLRRNRLRLLNQVRSIMNQIADFSRIEG